MPLDLADPATWSDVRDAVADKLAGMVKEVDGRGKLIASWQPVIEQAVGKAASDLLKIFLAKGFTLAELNGWSSLTVELIQQSLFRACEMNVAALQNPEAVAKNGMDCRADWATTEELLIGGVLTSPTPAAGGAIRAGVLDVRSMWERTPYVT